MNSEFDPSTATTLCMFNFGLISDYKLLGWICLVQRALAKSV